jgi:hypothetical protein
VSIDAAAFDGGSSGMPDEIIPRGKPEAKDYTLMIVELNDG